jgi:hypothetical protein
MCLEQVYLGAAIRQKLRSGPLGWLIEEFCGWMLGRGAARRVVQEHVSRVVLLSRGCKSQEAALRDGEARQLLSVLEARTERSVSCLCRPGFIPARGQVRAYMICAIRSPLAVY